MNTLLIAGSTAVQHWLKDTDYWRNPPTDLDYVGHTISFFDKYNKSNFKETIPNFLHTDTKQKIELLSVDLCSPLYNILKQNEDEQYLDLKNCLILKNSHKHFYRGRFDKSFKHLLDYSNLLKFVQLNEQDKQLSEQYRAWLIEYAYYNDIRLIKFPKLNKSKYEFFNDKVTYYVDHDLIHEKVAIESKPAYTKCLTGEVMFSTKLFSQLDYQSKVNMVLEEAFVLALERCLIPQFYGETYLPARTPANAFKYALVRVATNITSGDFRDFAADNFADIYIQFTNYHREYYKVIKDLLK